MVSRSTFSEASKGRIPLSAPASWLRWSQRKSVGRDVDSEVDTIVVELSVIVPAFNEEQTIEPFLKALRVVLKETVSSFEILMVDDGSRDATWSILCTLGPLYPELRALRLSRNFGKDAAVCAGVQEAQGRLCLIMDGDFEHPIELIPTMLQAYHSSGANVVNAVKTRASSERWTSKAVAKHFYRLFYLLSGQDLGGHTDFKLFDQKVRQSWLELRERSIFFRGMVAWMGYEQVSVHFNVPDVEGRSSRWTRPRLVALAVKSLTSFSSAPLQVVTLLGLVTFVFACFLGAHTFYTWWSGQAVEGFSTVILLQLIQGSVTMFALGIMGLYLARISEEVKSRPRYLVSERIEKP